MTSAVISQKFVGIKNTAHRTFNTQTCTKMILPWFSSKAVKTDRQMIHINITSLFPVSNTLE